MITAISRLFSTRPSLPAIPVSLFYRAGGYSVGDLKLDLVLSESHALTATVSSHPVENGSVISDHIRNELRIGSLRGLVSNHSLQYAPVFASDASLEDIVEEGKTVTRANVALGAWDILKALHERRELVTIVSVLEVYEDVAITSITTDRDSDTGEALNIDVTFQQVRKVQLKETQVTAQVQSADMSSTINRQASVRLNAGQKVGTNSFTMNEMLVKLGA